MADYLAVGATESLSVITSDSLSNITPQTRTLDFTPDFSISSGSDIVTIVATGSSLSTYDAIFFNTQIAVGSVLLQNSYAVNTVGGSSTFTIVASAESDSTIASSGILPVFATTADSASVTVTLPNNNYPATVGLFQGYYADTSVGGLTIGGRYETKSVLDSTQFTINSVTQASSAGSETMNGGDAELVFYVTEGPPASGGGYGVGGYGLGGYGLGSASTGGAGDTITATDWTMDNWGEILLACPFGGAIYTWSPNSGYTTASVIVEAPFFNGGIFVSMPQQILVCWASTESTGVKDPLIVRWSDSGDFTNWTASNDTSAGSFHIPTGSTLMGGLQAPNYGVVWTDIDVWLMQYVGGDVIFNFTRVGTGCGLAGPHAAGVINGDVYWCSASSFFKLSSNGMESVPCAVWDFIFQNLDTANVTKIRCAPNSQFNEISWFFPSSGGDGENDSYVKLNIQENAWDYGTLSRNAWIDVTALGNPIGTDTASIYQHEESTDAAGQPLAPYFESGYWAIADGNDMAFVDWFLPDMKFATYSGSGSASVQITLKALDYPGDTPRTYGPFTFTSSTQFLNPRLRGRLMSIIIESNDTGSFWRIGRCRYRWASAGRR